MIKKTTLLLFSSLISVFAQNTDLTNKINSILETLPKATKYGIMIYNPATKDTLYKKNIYEKMKPASNTKMFTTAVALSLMGSDSLISTTIYTDDFKIHNGVINGNIYIKGFGNSLFTDRDIDSLVSVLKIMGIHNITGNIIGDDSYFDSEYKRSDWIIDESDFGPLPPVSALSINKNKIQINLRASSTSGGAVSYSVFPECSLITIRNLAKTVKRKSSAHISQNFSNDNYEFIISGSLRRKSSASFQVEINNPPLFAAMLLKDRLLKKGILVKGSVITGTTPKPVRELCKKAYTVERLCSVANKRSDNFVAECLFKTIGACYGEGQGNGFYGTQAVFSYLKENKIYNDDIMIVDGSGLSHQNQVTVLTIVNLLERIYKSPDLYFDFFNSLSIAGKDGTLRNRLIDSNAEDNFHGKTGSLNGVIALSGFMKSRTGQDLIISMLFEYRNIGEYKIKRLTEQIIGLL